MAAYAGVICAKLRMVKPGGRPSRRDMAILAIIAGIQVAGRFTLSPHSSQASIMAAETVPVGLRMVKFSGGKRSPCCTCDMATFTAVAGIDMASNLFAGSLAVMAAGTVGNDAGMAELGSRPSRQAGMAILAGVRRQHVIETLAIGRRAVSAVADAACRVADDHGVESCSGWHPRGVDMAGGTVAWSFEVRGRLARSQPTIVTEIAGSGGIRFKMIKHRTRPGYRNVASLAQVRSRHMVARFAHCTRAIVAISAATNNSRVIKNSDCPVQ